MNRLATWLGGPAEAGSLLERGLALRDRLLASRDFQRRAAAFLPTRWVARRRARALFDLVAGFVYSQVLLACVRLRLFELLAEAPQPLDAIARRLALPADAAERLLAAAVSLRLVERRGGARYGLGPLGAPMVGNTAIASMVEHHAALYSDLRDPVALLRGQTGAAALAGYWPYASAGSPEALPGDRVVAYSTLMSASQPLVADEILDAYPIGRHRHLLDVGGGEGCFLGAVARRAPRLQLSLFDLPSVAERARQRLAEQRLAGSTQIVGGNFLVDELPRGADVVSLVRVVHDHDDGAAAALLRAVHRALPPGGTLLLAEPMSGTPGALPAGDAYFGMYLLAMGSGRPRTPEQLTALLAAAGFGRTRLAATHVPMQTRLLVTRRVG